MSLLSLTGLLLDATKNYMYVFLLAGCEVTLSAIVLALGNFFCIGKKPDDREAKMEMAVNAAEKEGLNPATEAEEDNKEPKERENGKVGALTMGEEVMTVKEMEEEGGEETPL